MNGIAKHKITEDRGIDYVSDYMVLMRCGRSLDPSVCHCTTSPPEPSGSTFNSQSWQLAIAHVPSMLKQRWIRTFSDLVWRRLSHYWWSSIHRAWSRSSSRLRKMKLTPAAAPFLREQC